MSLIRMAQKKKQMRGITNLFILAIYKHWLRPDTLKHLTSLHLVHFPPLCADRVWYLCDICCSK